MAATWANDNSLLDRKLEVRVSGASDKTAVVNVKDVCEDADCDGCCRENTNAAQYKLIDLEKWPASVLLGFDPSPSNFDINDVRYPTQDGRRPGASEGVMVLS